MSMTVREIYSRNFHFRLYFTHYAMMLPLRYYFRGFDAMGVLARLI